MVALDLLEVDFVTLEGGNVLVASLHSQYVLQTWPYQAHLL
jgi:hypothetical protein